MLGPLDKTYFDEPRGLALDPKGNVLLTTKSAVVYIDLEKEISSLVAGDLTNFGYRDGSLK